MSVNKVILVGHVGCDPEIRTFSEHSKVANFTLATTDRAFTTSGGVQIPEKTEWHSITAWAGLATISEKYIRKGSQLYIEGKIVTESYEKDGIKRYSTKIVADKIDMLGTKKEGVQELKAEPNPISNGIPQAIVPSQGEEDLPF